MDVAANGKPQMIKDQILCSPLKDFDTGEVYGVIEATQKRTPNVFNANDIQILEALGIQAVITLQNGIIYELGIAERRRNDAMLTLWQLFKSSNAESALQNMNSLLFTMTRKCLDIVNAEKCTFYFVNHAKKQMWSMQGEVNVHMSIDVGIAGHCATSGKISNIADVYSSDRFDQTHDKKTGFRTKSMLCVPMIDSSSGDANVLGVIQFINKNDTFDIAFDERDEQIVELVLSTAAPVFLRHKMFHPQFKDDKRMIADEKYVADVSAADLENPISEQKNMKILAEQNCIAEGDEDADDESEEC